MEWLEVSLKISGIVVAVFGTAWGINIYMAKPKKNSIEIDNMKKAMDELQNVIDKITQSSNEYREYTNKTISELKKEISELSLRVDIKHEAIYSARTCKFIKEEADCIVLDTFKKKCSECFKRESEV